MAQRQIVVRLHFQQARDGALEFEGAVPFRVKARWRGIGRRQQLHLIFVERVDQRHEARRLVALFGPEHRNADDDHRMIFARDGEIIGRAARFDAQPLEGEDGDALQALGHVQGAAALHRYLLGRHLGAILDRKVGQAEKGLRQGAGRFRTVGAMPELRVAQPVTAIIHRPVQRHHVQLRLDEVDEGQEQLAVEPVLVEIVGHAVGRGDDRHALVEQAGE